MLETTTVSTSAGVGIWPSVTVMQMVSVTISVTILRAWSARWAGEAATKTAPKAASMVEERILNNLGWVVVGSGSFLYDCRLAFEKVRQEYSGYSNRSMKGRKIEGGNRIGSTAVLMILSKN